MPLSMPWAATGMSSAEGRFGGPFLAGDWSIADAFFTPVATRFRTYQVPLADLGDADRTAAAYAERLLATPEYMEWEAAALAER